MSDEVGEIRPVTDAERQMAMDCLRCGMVVRSEGPLKLRVGGMGGGWSVVFGNIADIGEQTLELVLYSCANCGHVEFRVAADGG